MAMSPVIAHQTIENGPRENGLDPTDAEPDDDSSDDDSESDDDDDDDERGSSKKKTSVKDLLQEVLDKIQNGDLDLTNEQDYASFIKEVDVDYLASRTGNQNFPTALHELAAMDKAKFKSLDSKLQPLVTFLVKHRDRLRVKDSSHRTSLYVAIEEKKDKMVQWMCDAHRNIATILAMSDLRQMNCLHVAIDKRVKFLSLLVERANPSTLSARNSDGNTPLHLAVEYRKCRKGQLGIIERIAHDSLKCVPDKDDFNNAGLSPFLHHKKSVEKAEMKAQEKMLKRKAKEESGKEKTNSHRPNPGIIDDPRGRSKGTGPKVGNLPYSGPIPGPDFGSRDGPAYTYMYPGARHKDGGKSTQMQPKTGPLENLIAPGGFEPYEEKKALHVVESTADKKERTNKSSSKVDEETVKSVECFLKLHYLRHRHYSIAMEILYGRHTISENQLYFGITGDVKDDYKITQTKLDQLLLKFKFEDVLQYVAVQNLRVELDQTSSSNEPSKISRQSAKSDEAGRQDLYYIFDQLRKKGVKTVLKVFVDDFESPAHSDERIEKSLATMDVEVWDWRKLDLCTEVIYNVAPRAREVHLHWSGNNAVLRGWSEDGGLKKLRHLRTLYLHTHRGLESRSRTQHHVKDFLDRMKRLCPEVQIIEEGSTVRREKAVSGLGGATEQHPPSTKHMWIKCMTDFLKLLVDAEKYYGLQKIENDIKEPISIALIDDGVDFKDLEYKFIGGRTFCMRDEEHHLNDPHYESSSGHGTDMAKQIHRLCPRAQFYVLRMEDHPSDEPGIQITARSAAQAIRAAVRKKVHIISMSWTIDPPEDKEVRQELDDAITEAANSDILMFCSASDKGPKQSDTYPAKATSNIFTIGAATAAGNADPRVGDLSNISFTFPGNEVEVDGGPAELTAKEVTGSSVATALAAGLAALILYCAQLRLMLAPEDRKSKARLDFDALKKHEGMMKAFKIIGTTETSNHKFLKVWDIFGKQVKEKEKTAEDEHINLVADVGAALCRKI